MSVNWLLVNPSLMPINAKREGSSTWAVPLEQQRLRNKYIKKVFKQTIGSAKKIQIVSDHFSD